MSALRWHEAGIISLFLTASIIGLGWTNRCDWIMDGLGGIAGVNLLCQVCFQVTHSPFPVLEQSMLFI